MVTDGMRRSLVEVRQDGSTRCGACTYNTRVRAAVQRYVRCGRHRRRATHTADTIAPLDDPESAVEPGAQLDTGRRGVDGDSCMPVHRRFEDHQLYEPEDCV